MDQEQPGNTASQEHAEDSSLDAAVEAMMNRAKAQEPGDKPEGEQSPQETASDPESAATETDSTTEAEDGQPENEEPSQKLVEIEIEGKQYRVPEEIKDGYLRQSDYTRKTQAVAAREKNAEAHEGRIKAIEEGMGEFIGVVAQRQMLDARLKELDKVDWQSLRASDPQQFMLLSTDRQNLVLEAQAMDAKARGVLQSVQAKKAEGFAQKRAAMFDALEKSDLKWSDDVGAKVSGYAVKSGYAFEEVQQWTDPRMVTMAEKARRYDELKAKNPEVTKKVSVASKPNPPGSQQGRPDVAKATMDRLRRDGSLDATADALMARAQARQRRN